MHKLEAVEATIRGLSQAERLRQSIAVRGDRPPKGLRKAGRLFRTAERILEECNQLTSFNRELAPKTPPVEEQLIEIRNNAEVCLKTSQVLGDPHKFAEYRLQQVWAEAKLDGVKERTLKVKVCSLIDRLYLRDGGWLLHIVGANEQGRPVRRYEDMINLLETSLVQPPANRSRV